MLKSTSHKRHHHGDDQCREELDAYDHDDRSKLDHTDIGGDISLDPSVDRSCHRHEWSDVYLYAQQYEP